MVFDVELLSIALLIGVSPITGSFMGVLITRIPEGRTVFVDRSACDNCGHVLDVWDLMPVVNWLVSRGRCRYCGAAVGAFYPLIELSAVAVALWAWTATTGWHMWLTSTLGWLAVVMALIELRDRLAPRGVSLALIGFGALAAWASAAPVDHLLGAVGGLALGAGGWLIDRWTGSRLGIGPDHALLLAAAGLWITWQGLPDVIIGGVLAGALMAAMGLAGRETRVAVAAPICLATWLAWLYGPVILG